MTEEAIQSKIIGLATQLGDLGVFIAMFLESSVVPIPSELIVIGAGSIGIPLASILVFGSLGSTLGGVLGYSLGRYAAMPVILKFGKYILIKPHHIERAEAFAKKYGVWGVLIGRMLPVVPFKVFSIAAGITKLPFVPFVVCTLIGVLPRMYLLAIFGAAMANYKKPTILLLIMIGFVFLGFKITKAFYSKKNLKAEIRR